MNLIKMLMLLLSFLYLPSTVFADGYPWQSSEHECHQWWFNRWNGAKIDLEGFRRREKEVPFDIANTQAQIEMTTQLMRSTSSDFDRYMQMVFDREELVPQQERLLKLATDVYNIFTKDVQSGIGKTFALVKWIKKEMDLSSSEGLALLAAHPADGISLSLVLDMWVKDGESISVEPSQNLTSEQIQDNIRQQKISVRLILDQLEDEIASVKLGSEKVLVTLGALIAEINLQLKTSKQFLKLAREGGELKRKQDDRDDAVLKNQQAIFRMRALNDERNNIPAAINNRIYVMNEAFPYWCGENKCHKYWD